MPKFDKATYNCWYNLIRRCTDVTHRSYAIYGGRGIKVCDRWLQSYESFVADMGAKPVGLQIDRIDSNGNYEILNCRWSTVSDNAKNKRNKSSIQSKYHGVSWCKNTKSWSTNIYKSGFKSEEEAHAYYLRLKTV